MDGVFITGTDTGVGKTIVAAALLAALRARGVDAAPMKPVQTGADGHADDLAFSLATAAMTPSESELASMRPYAFPPACSPHLAARLAGESVSISRVMDCAARLGRGRQAVVVEGAGGVLVPLNERETMLDLMAGLALPVVVVARPGLGTLNHTLLTTRVLREAGLRVEGALLNEGVGGAWGAIEEDNLQTLKRLSGVPFVARFPRCDTAVSGRLAASDLVAAGAVLGPLVTRLLTPLAAGAPPPL